MLGNVDVRERERGTRCRREERQWHRAVGPIDARVCGVLIPSSEIVDNNYLYFWNGQIIEYQRWFRVLIKCGSDPTKLDVNERSRVVKIECLP